MSERRYRAALVALTLLLGAVLSLWAVLTPGFRSPDEPQHVNSTLRLLDGGGWPAPGEAAVMDGVRVAAEEAGWVRTEDPPIRQASSALPRGLIVSGPPFAGLDPGDPADRSVVLDVPPLDPGTTPPAVDQMTQHPPAHYAIGAGLLRVLGAEDWRWDQQLLALRLLGAFMVMWVAPLAAATTRNIGGSPAAALLAAASLVAVPQLGHIGASVTNDSLVALAGAAVVWCTSLALTRRHSWPLVVGTGVVLGVALLTKGFLLAGIPVVAAGFVLGRRANPRAGRRWWAAFASLAVAFAVGGWWWARNLVVHGKLQPDGMPPRTFDGDTDPQPAEYLRLVVTELTGSFWGNFGWLEMPWPTLLTQLGTVAVVVAVVVAVLLHRRRLPLLVLLALPVLTVAVIVVNGWGGYAERGWVAGMQGRYLFAGLVPLAACAGIAVDRVAGLLPRVAQVPARLTLPLASLALGAYGLLFAFRGFYQPVGEPVLTALGRWEAWSLLDRSGIAVALALPALAAVCALALLVSALRAKSPTAAYEPANP